MTSIRFHSRSRRRQISLSRCLAISLSLCCLWSALAEGSRTKANGDPIDYLDEDSVILITGAAGFIGSELALALYRTYSPKRIICVDKMGGDHPSTQEALALFEFQRQRAFHVLQVLGERARFYRVDFRPMIPEYFDVGEVPALDHIFRENPDITHIVHLADAFPHSALQVIPREKDVPKAGMIESLFEQMRKIEREGGRPPHFSYASSYEVYPFADDSTLSPLVETQTIQTPSSIRGASKLVDEILAKFYYDEYSLYSVGLRLFSVYGPWSVPGSPLFEMAERAVNRQLAITNPEWDSIQDFVYIDDAVDAIMTAMQFRPDTERPHPLVVNVGSGKGASLQDVADIMRGLLVQSAAGDRPAEREADSEYKTTVAFASIARAQQLLGYEPQISLKDGIVKLLAWHYDRAYPYGASEVPDSNPMGYIAAQGVVQCLPDDKECLNAAPVFPCSSECAHEVQCTNSFFDEVVGWTQALTAACQSVLYTVAFDDSLESIPSANERMSTEQSFLDGNCNLAFVSEKSALVQSLRQGTTEKKVLTHGKWILVPVVLPTIYNGDESVLKLLPKLSPGLFFGAAVTRAIYIDHDILLKDVQKLLHEASMQPLNEDVDGATALLIGRREPKSFFRPDEDDDMPKQQVLESRKSTIQNSAYRMIRIAVSDNLFGDGFVALLDSRWMVHTLQSDDSRLFRCDVLGEVVQWEVDTDRSALEFVLGLHDMWSRVIAEKPWWVGDEDVITVAESQARRRLQEIGDDAEANEDDEVADEDEDSENEPGVFQLKDEVVEEVAAGDKDRGGSSDEEFDEGMDEDQGDETDTREERDFSAYDTWMGVLSASETKYFVRIVPSSEVGVMSLDEYDEATSQNRR